MRIDVAVRDAEPTDADRHTYVRLDGRTLTVYLDAAGLDTPARLFDALSDALGFPAYFGRNWDALNECLSDYLVIERGGLGSEFGGVPGVDADTVRLTFGRAAGLVEEDAGLLADLVAVLRHTREVNSERRAADLTVVFETEPTDPIETRSLVRTLVADGWPGEGDGD